VKEIENKNNKNNTCKSVSAVMTLDNSNPNIFNQIKDRDVTPGDWDDSITDDIDSREIFDLIRNIKDPEHPLTLEQLNVVSEDNISIDKNAVVVKFTPTITHCSLATLIGLSIQVKLLRTLPSRLKIEVKITEGSHSTEEAVNKQLGDKERVAAALENPNLVEVVNQCISSS